MNLSGSDFDYLRRLIRQHSAIVLEDGKEYLVEFRLSAIMRAAGLKSMKELVARLRADRCRDLQRRVVEAMTTNETSFFRDVHPFETLRQVVLPELINHRGTERNLNIWSAACASGQEAYSIAMVIREFFPTLKDWNLYLLASDLSSEMVTRAQKGRYTQLEVNRGLPAAMLVKYFEQVGMDWSIKGEFRKMIDFRVINLAESWPMQSAMDIVFLRNVLIYFDDATKKTVLAKIHRLLRPKGYLFLGDSETTLHLDARFEQVRMGKTLCYRASG